MEYKALISAVPYQSFQLLMDKLKLTEDDLLVLGRHRDFFISRQAVFAEFFHKSFIEIPETRMLLEHFGKADAMKLIWAEWFGRLFSENLDTNFINYLWRIGLRHVEVNLDQRFTNLGFSLVRMFCHRITIESFQPDIAVKILPVVDKLVDSCILVETSAYIMATVRCDVEILKGIADKIRNPVTIIGGNLRRLQRHMAPQDPLYKDYEFLISSTSRCEDMIEDITTYIEMFQREAKFEQAMLETVIENMLEKLSARKKLEGVKVEIFLSPEARFVRGDPTDLRHLFYHILENAVEAAHASKKPYVRISSVLQEVPSHTLRIEVFNNGEIVNLANISDIFSLFYSTKPKGSGLGLSIAKLALRKNFGEIYFEPVPGEGTKVYIILEKAN
ncbi:MAG: GHKL domain-containing protein [Nitrospirae bacterium]|nr:MAG: GHKL domain-containing protein [Nitrospirota bacterium]